MQARDNGDLASAAVTEVEGVTQAPDMGTG